MIINVKDAVVQGVNITIPTWVNWIAVDSNGESWGYQLKPVCTGKSWFEGNEEKFSDQQLFEVELTNNEKWQDLLFYVGDE